jgi:hypothetical protein
MHLRERLATMRRNHRRNDDGKDGDDRYELRFQSLYEPGRALSFPCDSQGRVDTERLSEKARDNLRTARALVGSEWSTPEVVRVHR